MRNKKTSILFFLVLFFVLAGTFFFVPVQNVHAQWGFLDTNQVVNIATTLGDKLLGSAVQEAVKGILYVVTFVAQVVFWLGAQLISFAFSLNLKVLEIPMVTMGWGIVRDIANLGFVLAIIVMAIATIVRYKDYGAQKLLPKLIAAAILVNFSLTIGGVVLDFSNTISGFFLDRSSSNGKGVFALQENLATAFSPQKLSNFDPAAASVVQGTGMMEALISIIGLLFAGAFTFLAALTLLGIALMLLIRFIWLVLLLIISPITWFFWVVPDLAGEFKSWWKNFFKWCFYAPTLSFFLYLTIYSVDALSDINKAYQAAATAANGGVNPTTNINLPILNGFQQISNMIVIIGLLVGGLMVAQSMSGTGADKMMNLASKAGKGVGKWAGGRAKQTGRNMGRRALAGGVDESGQTRLERFTKTRFGQRLAKVPFVGGAITGVAGVSSRAKDAMKKEIDEKEKKYDVRTKEDLTAIATRSFNNTPQDDVALMKSIAKKGAWKDLNGKTQDRLINSAKRLGVGDQITPLVPHLAGKFATFEKNATPEERAGKIKTAEAKVAAKLTEVPKNIDDSEETKSFYRNNAEHFSSNMIDQFGTSIAMNSDGVREALKEGLEKHTNDIEIKIKDVGGKEVSYTGYKGVKTLRESMDKHKIEIEKYDDEIESLTADVEAASGTEKEEMKKDLATINKERKDLKDLKRRENEELTKTLKSLGREKARAVDSLDKMEKNPAYKSAAGSTPTTSA